MMAERRRHLKADTELSPAAQAIVHAAFEEGAPTYQEIAAAILAQTGEKISKSGLGNYWRFWNIQRRAREARAVALEKLEDLRKLPPERLDEVIEQLLRTAAYEDLAEAEAGEKDAGQALLALSRRERSKQQNRKLDLEQDRNVLEGQRLKIEERRIEALERRVAAMEAAAAGATAALDTVAKKKHITAEDLQEIRAKYYGI